MRASTTLEKNKYLESWIWYACSIRGAKDAPKNIGCIGPLFIKYLIAEMCGLTIQVLSRKYGFRAKLYEFGLTS